MRKAYFLFYTILNILMLPLLKIITIQLTTNQYYCFKFNKKYYYVDILYEISVSEI